MEPRLRQGSDQPLPPAVIAAADPPGRGQVAALAQSWRSARQAGGLDCPLRRRPDRDARCGGLKFYGATSMLFSDPPVHTRLRRLVTRAFSPRRIRDLAPMITSIVVRMVDAVAARGTFEVMKDLAWPLPMAVI